MSDLATDIARLRELTKPPRIIPAEGMPPVTLVSGNVELAEALAISFRIALPLADALTAAAERETTLREENDRLTAANESVAVCRKHVADITADGCWVCSAQAAEAEVERLKLDRDSWERCALNTEVTLQAERQKVTTFRNKIETGHKYLTPHRATTLIGWMDALGLVKQPGIVELQSGLTPDPPREK